MQSGGCLHVLLDKYAGSLMKVTVVLVDKNVASLATIASASAIDGTIKIKPVEEVL